MWVGLGGGLDVGGGIRGGGQNRMGTCGGYGREMRAGNLPWHQRGACRVWDPGGGGKPLTEVDGPMHGTEPALGATVVKKGEMIE